MVSVLAFDTAGNGCSAAVLRDGEIAARRFAAMARGQSEQLLPMIETVLGEAGLAVAALDLIAVTVGPGAFTGLRIGIAAARGLALASGVPALGITSFAAVAAQVPREARAGRALVVALDSRRAEFYLQAFDADGVPLGDGALVAPADLAGWVPAGSLLLVGDAAPGVAAALAARRPEVALGSGIADAADIARLCVHLAARPAPGTAASALPPVARHHGAAPGDSTMTRRLRPVDAVDVGGLARLHAQCFPDDRWDAAALAELLAMRGASGHLIEDTGEGRPLGLILDLILAEHAEVLTLGVAPPARRSGVARAMLDDLFRRARLAGAHSIGLEAAADNLAARRLYEACGFSQTGQRPGYYRRAGATVDALVFRRTLLG